MNLQEEVDHYLAGLRESSPIPNSAAITLNISENQGKDKVINSSRNEIRERPLKNIRQLLQQVASCDDSIYFGEKAVVLSQAFAALETGTLSPASLTRAAASCIKESVHDVRKSNMDSDMISQDPAIIAETQHATPGMLVPNHCEAQGTNGERLSETSNIVDVGADNELDIFQHYASAKSSEASLSDQSLPAFEKDIVIANEQDYQVLPPSSNVEEEDWDDCRVAEP